MSNQWNTNVFCPCSNVCNCLYAFYCPVCALATAKSKFDGSNCLWNCCCFTSIPVNYNYIRTGYDIEGRVGRDDCCVAGICAPCAIAQLLNEVGIRGPVQRPPEGGWQAPSREYSCLGDPVDCCMTCACCLCEVKTLYSQLTGTPLWFGANFGVNLCHLHHLTRMTYNIPGSSCWNDCCVIALCVWNPIYIYKLIAQIRAEIDLRQKDGGGAAVTVVRATPVSVSK